MAGIRQEGGGGGVTKSVPFSVLARSFFRCFGELVALCTVLSWGEGQSEEMETECVGLVLVARSPSSDSTGLRAGLVYVRLLLLPKGRRERTWNEGLMGPMRQAGLAGDAINRQTWLLAASFGAVLNVLIWSMWCWVAVSAVASALGIGSDGRSGTLLCREVEDMRGG